MSLFLTQGQTSYIYWVIRSAVGLIVCTSGGTQTLWYRPWEGGGTLTINLWVGVCHRDNETLTPYQMITLILQPCSRLGTKNPNPINPRLTTTYLPCRNFINTEVQHTLNSLQYILQFYFRVSISIIKFWVKTLF